MKTRTVLSAVSRIALAAATAAAALPAVAATGDDLVQPKTLIVDKTLSKQQAEQQIRAARLYDTFWSTGDEARPRGAGGRFHGPHLPAGRPQGIAGPLAASQGFHRAVPDVHADVEQMIVAGDRVVTHLHFTGHFTGTFNGVQGRGKWSTSSPRTSIAFATARSPTTGISKTT